MSSYVQMLEERNLIKPPKWLSNNIQYEVISGSRSYGVHREDSDYDLVGFCIPEKYILFPHLRPGYIDGFGKKPKAFENYKTGKVMDNSSHKEYDATIYSIVRYFQLCMENNANMVDSMFVSNELVTVSSPIGQMVRDNRKIFLHKGCWHKFKGYAFAQRNFAGSKKKGVRVDLVEKYGYDVKAASHCVRLINEVEMILEEGDLDLFRNNDHVKAIKNGLISKQDFDNWFTTKELTLEKLYSESKLPYGPPEDKIRQLLMDCLEHHYGSLENAYIKPASPKRFKHRNFKAVDEKRGDEARFTGIDEFVENVGHENIINVQASSNSVVIYYWGE